MEGELLQMLLALFAYKVWQRCEETVSWAIHSCVLCPAFHGLFNLQHLGVALEGVKENAAMSLCSPATFASSSLHEHALSSLPMQWQQPIAPFKCFHIVLLFTGRPGQAFQPSFHRKDNSNIEKSLSRLDFPLNHSLFQISIQAGVGTVLILYLMLSISLRCSATSNSSTSVK